MRESHGGLHRHGNLRAEVLQFRRNIVVRYRIPLDLNKDDGVICRQSTFFADGHARPSDLLGPDISLNMSRARVSRKLARKAFGRLAWACRRTLAYEEMKDDVEIDPCAMPSWPQ